MKCIPIYVSTCSSYEYPSFDFEDTREGSVVINQLLDRLSAGTSLKTCHQAYEKFREEILHITPDFEAVDLGKYWLGRFEKLPKDSLENVLYCFKNNSYTELIIRDPRRKFIKVKNYEMGAVKNGSVIGTYYPKGMKKPITSVWA